MKKICCLLLCLMLALAAPLSALAEPQSWLLPFIKRGNTVKSGEAVMAVHMDAEAVMAVIDWNYDMELKAYDELAASLNASSDGALQASINNYKQSLATSRATAKAYIPGAAALVDASVLLIRSGENSSAMEYRVDGTTWFTLNMINRPEEGDVLLTSDLFPTCAVSLPRSEATDGASGEAVLKLLGIWQKLLPTLSDYEGFDLLGSIYEADVQALALLEAEGLARREGDALVYERTDSLPGAYASIPDEAEDALYQRRAMDVDERVYQLYDLTAPLRADVTASSSPEEEGAPDTLPVLSENPTREEYWAAYEEYCRLMNKNRTQTTIQTRRVTLENGVITNETTVTVSTHYEPLADEAGTLEKLRENFHYFSAYRDYEEVTQYVSRHTPTTYEYRRAPNDYNESILLLDTGAENEIVFTATSIYHNSGFEDDKIIIEARLTRTEEGQQWALTVPVQRSADAEPLRASLSLDNDVSRMDLTFSMLGRELGSIRTEYAYSEEPASLPDISGLTVIPYDGDKEAMNALYADLKAVGVPRLTRLITTGLPDGAKGLIAPLLAAVASLGQLMQ